MSLHKVQTFKKHFLFTYSKYIENWSRGWSISIKEHQSETKQKANILSLLCVCFGNTIIGWVFMFPAFCISWVSVCLLFLSFKKLNTSYGSIIVLWMYKCTNVYFENTIISNTYVTIIKQKRIVFTSDANTGYLWWSFMPILQHLIQSLTFLYINESFN